MDRQYGIQLKQDESGGDYIQAYCYGENGLNWGALAASETVDLTKWTHIQVVYDGNKFWISTETEENEGIWTDLTKSGYTNEGIVLGEHSEDQFTVGYNYTKSLSEAFPGYLSDIEMYRMEDTLTPEYQCENAEAVPALVEKLKAKGAILRSEVNGSESYTYEAKWLADGEEMAGTEIFETEKQYTVQITFRANGEEIFDEESRPTVLTVGDETVTPETEIMLDQKTMVVSYTFPLFSEGTDEPVAEYEKVDRSLLWVEADSEELTGELADNGSGPAFCAIDGDEATYWHTNWSDSNAPKAEGTPDALEYGNTITLRLSTPQNLAGITYLPRQKEENGNNGPIKECNIYISTEEDGSFGEIPYMRNVLVGTYDSGDWNADIAEKQILFDEVQNGVTAVKLEVTKVLVRGSTPYINAAEIGLLKKEGSRPGRPGEITELIDIAANSQMTEPSGNDGPAEWAFDDEEHWWHSNWGAVEEGNIEGRPSEETPIWIQAGWNGRKTIAKVTYKGRTELMGRIKSYTLQIADLEPGQKPTDDDFHTVKTSPAVLDLTDEEQEITLATPARATHIRLVVTSVYQAGDGSGAIGMNFVAAQRIRIFEDTAPTETEIVEVNSSVLAENADANSYMVNGSYGGDGDASSAFNEDEQSWWHSNWIGPYTEYNVEGWLEEGRTEAIWIQTGFNASRWVSGLVYQGLSRGSQIIENFEIWVSDDEEKPDVRFRAEDVGMQKVTGQNISRFEETTEAQKVTFDLVSARWIRLVAKSVYPTRGEYYVGAQNIKIFAAAKKGETIRQIAVTREPQLTYTIGEAFCRDGMEITGYYNNENGDGSGDRICRNLADEAEITGYDPLELGEQTLTVKVGDAETELTVEVVPMDPSQANILVGIKAAPGKERFQAGEDITTGAVVEKIYGDGHKETLTDMAGVTFETAYDQNFSPSGGYQVKVTYVSDGKTFEAFYMATVEEGGMKQPEEIVEINKDVLIANAEANSYTEKWYYGGDGGAADAFSDDPESWWHSNWSGLYTDDNIDGSIEDGGTEAVWIQTGFDESRQVCGLVYQGLSRGTQIIENFEIWVSDDEEKPDVRIKAEDAGMKKVTRLSSSVFENTTEAQEVLFYTASARWIRLVAKSAYSIGQQHYVGAQNIKILAAAKEGETIRQIAVTQEPRLTYTIGEDFCRDGMEITGYYDNANGDGSGERGRRNLAGEAEITGYDPLELGEQTLTVKVENAETELTVKVLPMDPSQANILVGIKAAPGKETFRPGESITEDAIVRKIYGDGRAETATADDSVIFETDYDPNVSPAGCYLVTVKYTEGEKVCEASYMAEVREDYTKLDKEIKIAEDLKEKDYTEGWDAFLQAFEEAKALRNAQEPVTCEIQKEIDAHADALEAAIQNLVIKVEAPELPSKYKVMVRIEKEGEAPVEKQVAEKEYNTRVEVHEKDYRMDAGVDDGAKFVGWKEGEKIISTQADYSFYIAGDITLMPVYETPEQPQKVEAQALMSNVIVIQGENGKVNVKFIGQLVLPEGCKLVQAGLIWGVNKNEEDLVVNEEKRTIKNGSVTVVQTVNKSYQYSVTLNGLAKGKFLSGKTYMYYKDAEGNYKWAFSDVTKVINSDGNANSISLVNLAK